MEVTGDALGELVGLEVIGGKEGEFVGSDDTGEPLGEFVGLKVTGDREGEFVGSDDTGD